MGSKHLVALFVLVFVVYIVNCQERVGGGGSTIEKLSKLYKYFVGNGCNEQRDARKTYSDFYTLITLKCDWVRFVNTASDASRSALTSSDDQAAAGSSRRRPGPVKPSSSADLEIYEIEFYGRSDSPRYRTVTAKQFEGFNVRSLKLSGLYIERIDENAFASSSFAKYLQALDLSQNALKRIDSHVLSNLKSLQHLNLSSNRLTFGEHNFDSNINLRTLDISNNDLQFLSPKVFSRMHRLERLNIARNHLRSLDACTFASVQTSPIATTYSPVTIDLQENPIDCDCQVFYLNRYLNYRLNLTCEKPSYYKGKKFDDLKREDPAYRCDYEKINAKCRPHESIPERDFYFLVVTGSIIAFLIVLSCCCCCNNIAQSGRAMRMKTALAHAKKSAQVTKTSQYVTITPKDDQQKLIIQDK